MAADATMIDEAAARRDTASWTIEGVVLRVVEVAAAPWLSIGLPR